MGSVDDASNAEILQRWMDLIRKSDEIGQRFIANADWAALRDATVTWTQNDRDSKKSNMNSTQISRTATPSPSLTPMDTPAPEHLFNNPQNPMDFYSHPALQAATASGGKLLKPAERRRRRYGVDGRMVNINF